MCSHLTVFLSISFIKSPFSFPSDFCQRSGWKLIFKGTQHYWSNFGAINGNYNQQCPPIAWYGDTCEYVFIVFHLCKIPKGKLISKWFMESSISSKRRTNEFVFTSKWIVFVRFLEENDNLKKPFRN